MKRIVFVVGGMTRGGAERVISILANEYAKRGYSVSIVLMLDYIIKYELHDSINVINLTGDSSSRVKKIPYWIRGLNRIFRSINPDIIVSFVARINILVLLASLFNRAKVVVSERNDPAKDGRSCLIDLATCLLYPRADKIIFQTQRAKKYFNKRIQSRGVIIPNPIEVKTLACKDKKKKIVAVGRLAPQKNHKLLINAFSVICESYEEYELWIYGEGQLRDELERYVEYKKLENKVHLPGNVDNVHECIKDAEIFVLSSDYEGLSNALLEAMMMGLPCISTNCAGADEYIVNDNNGKLIHVNNLKELVDALDSLIKDENMRNVIAVNARKSIIGKCAKEHVIEEWCETIEGGC